MQFILNNINLKTEYDDESAIKFVKDKFFKKIDIKEISIFKKSVDARDKNNIKFCYSFLVDTNKEEYKKISKIKNLKP